MPDLFNFARRIRRRGRMVEEGSSRIVVETAIVIDQAVVLATPVDTGRARANWQAAIGAPITEATEETDQSGQTTLSRNNAVIRTHRGGQTVYLSNNVAYIGALNNGSSSQAPANFVGIAVRDAQDFLRRRKVIS